MILIDRDRSVTEVVVDENAWSTETELETISAIAPGHDAHVEAEAAFDPLVVRVAFAGRPDVPLPAWISGHEGERTTDATMSVEEASALLT